MSDFYTAYDSLMCPQQKCLIHLIRDMSQAILEHPFVGEPQSMFERFGNRPQTFGDLRLVRA